MKLFYFFINIYISIVLCCETLKTNPIIFGTARKTVMPLQRVIVLIIRDFFEISHIMVTVAELF